MNDEQKATLAGRVAAHHRRAAIELRARGDQLYADATNVELRAAECEALADRLERVDQP